MCSESVNMICEAHFFTCCPFLLSDVGVELPLRERQDLEPGTLSMILCQMSPLNPQGWWKGKTKIIWTSFFVTSVALYSRSSEDFFDGCFRRTRASSSPQQRQP